MSEDDIKAMFGGFGGVVAVTIVKDQLNRSKGFGFVEVRSPLIRFPSHVLVSLSISRPQ